MIPVMQTRLAGGDARGNCTEACYASLLNLSIDQVPDLWVWEQENESLPWQSKIEEWLKPMGLTIVQGCVSGFGYLPDFYHILSGPGPRGYRHAVVACGGNVVHDPHPLGGGLVQAETLTMIVPLDVGVFIQGI